MTSISSGGINQQSPIDYEPIDMALVKPEVASKVAEVESDFLARIDDLKAQIAEDPRSARALELKGEVTRLENAFRDFSESVTSFVTTTDEGVPWIHEDTHLLPREMLQGFVREMQVELGASYETYGTAVGGGGVTTASELTMSSMELRAPKLSNLQVSKHHVSEAGKALLRRMETNEGVEKGGNTQGSGATDSPGASSETKEGGKTAADFEVAEMVNLLSSDPDAFMQELSAIVDPQERAALMTLVQSKLQQINQLFSMVSQFSQAMHDTSKAIISNLRV
ncbi:hypothetical protein DV096_07845 [Bradymonadaceae bacterium TMQ3]|uniref:DUF3102 domain-containing protein n=1 Tax=Lujinxingia sediminis TaxID=2480984 RepID=A0ABY0CTF6_9DELT|nr:hypothetical protein [Lujinxingia sediminis]RDV38710.1 hypothetical protein DV096_07845 [Bradymonadaceae bacterium TMQ3]RVU44737.1 hypothetical protein EA187_09345 [Lujinxingia sediminis]TXC76517.1 hypothetical protein FRC91_07230 [Bradymonadales bacterium TMQ1]